jgi:hypothetical protein
MTADGAISILVRPELLASLPPDVQALMQRAALRRLDVRCECDECRGITKKTREYVYSPSRVDPPSLSVQVKPDRGGNYRLYGKTKTTYADLQARIKNEAA